MTFNKYPLSPGKNGSSLPLSFNLFCQVKKYFEWRRDSLLCLNFIKCVLKFKPSTRGSIFKSQQYQRSLSPGKNGSSFPLSLNFFCQVKRYFQWSWCFWKFKRLLSAFARLPALLLFQFSLRVMPAICIFEFACSLPLPSLPFHTDSYLFLCIRGFCLQEIDR